MAALIAYGLYTAAGVLLCAVGVRHRRALFLVVQAWLLRLLASLIVVVAIAGGAWLLRFGHPGFVILALLLARGAWATGNGLHAAAAASPDRRRHGLPRHLRAPPGERKAVALEVLSVVRKPRQPATERPASAGEDPN
jgi:hypothetical protein